MVITCKPSARLAVPTWICTKQTNKKKLFWLPASFCHVWTQSHDKQRLTVLRQNYLIYLRGPTKSGSDPNLCFHCALREELHFLYFSCIHMDGPWKDNIHSQSLATPLFHLSLSPGAWNSCFTWRLFKRVVYLYHFAPTVSPSGKSILRLPLNLSHLKLKC